MANSSRYNGVISAKEIAEAKFKVQGYQGAVMANNGAVCAKELVEAKFKVQDYQGAVYCAYFAKGILPGLDGMDDMLAAYQVHLDAAKKDWPAVLGVDASTNLGEIKKQYKRKAMLVHPDKNSSEAANDAFKFLTKAYELLSKSQTTTTYPGSSSSHQSQPAAPASSSTRQSQTASSLNRRSQSASAFERSCPRCHKVCFFGTLKRSSITCSDCGRKFVFKAGKKPA